MAPLTDEVAANVRRQVEFYFSDSNLPNDRFLLRTINESPDGLVSIPVICAFQRMKNHLSLDPKIAPEAVPAEVATAVGEALKTCSSLKVSEDGLKVGRSKTFSGPEELLALVKIRTRAVSPLPWKEKRENVERFFNGISKVLSVRMPRHPRVQRAFVGSALVEFSTVEEAQRVSEMKLTYNGVELEFQDKNAFDEYMNTLRKSGPKGPASFTKGLIVKFRLESRKADENAVVETKMEVDGETKDENKEVDTKDENKAEDEKKPEADNKEDGDENKAEGEKKDDEDLIRREDIKAVLEQYGSVKFIDFTKGGSSGFIRFELADGALKARTAAVIAEEGGLVIKNQIAILEAVDGEEEKRYWDSIIDSQARKQEQYNNAYKGKRKGKRNFDGEPRGKSQKTE